VLKNGARIWVSSWARERGNAHSREPPSATRFSEEVHVKGPDANVWGRNVFLIVLGRVFVIINHCM
jgi:hypothetical protein